MEGLISLLTCVKQQCFIKKTNERSIKGSETLEGEGNVQEKIRFFE